MVCFDLMCCLWWDFLRCFVFILYNLLLWLRFFVVLFGNCDLVVGNDLLFGLITLYLVYDLLVCCGWLFVLCRCRFLVV